MQKHQVFWASVFANLLTLLLLPEIAHAQVSCPPATGGTYTSINAALSTLTPTGPNRITVTGTCNENVTIGDFRELTIVAGAGGARIVAPQDSDAFDIFRSQQIRLVNLEIAGAAGAGVFITSASDVQINGCDIHDNQASGVYETDNSLLYLNNTNIHNNNPSDGLDVVGGSTARVTGTTIQNNGSPGVLTLGNPATATAGVGVFVAGNSSASFREYDSFPGAPRETLIQNNADVGIMVRDLSTVTLGAASGTGTTIQGHNLDGIVVQLGGHLQVNAAALIQGNGVACPPVTSIACGGIFGAGNATVELAGVGTISGNHGAGIFAEQGTNLHLNGLRSPTTLETVSISGGSPLRTSESSAAVLTP